MIAKGAFLKIKGVTTIDRFDSELTIGSVIGIKKIPSFVSTRMDTSPVKRVELHCHTKMSDMDGVSDVKDIIKRAMKWGHKAHRHHRSRRCTGVPGCKSCHWKGR